MTVTITRFVRFENEGALKAFCDVSIGGLILIKGIRVIEGRMGPFISMPRQQNKAGKWYDSVVPLDRHIKAEIQRVVLGAYETQPTAVTDRLYEMTKMISRPSTLHALLLACSLLANLVGIDDVFAAVPHLIRYQGQAVDSKAVPLDGPYTLTFRLYDAVTAGNQVWQEQQTAVPVSAGYFSVLLGSQTSLDPVDWSKPLWLSVQVNTDPELAPRQQITSVPWAVRAESAEKLTQAITPALITPQGSGSSLDADTVDGKHASELLSRANHTGTQSSSTITGTFAPSVISPQGSGSGLDADTVDGQHATAFASAGHTHPLVCQSWQVTGGGTPSMTATVPDGSYQRTGGGCSGFISGRAGRVEVPTESFPDSGNGWVCQSLDGSYLSSITVYVVGCRVSP